MTNIVSAAASAIGTDEDDIIVIVEAGAPNGPDTVSGGQGNDVIIGDHAPVFVDSVATNGTIAHAMSIDAVANWSVQDNQDVAGIPYTTVMGTGAGAYDVYSVTVGAGQTITLDVDFANFDGEISLYDADGNLVGTNDDGSATDGGLGSDTARDPFLTHMATTAGTYYIRVEAYNVSADPILVGQTYQLNVGVSAHAAVGAVFDSSVGNATKDTALNIDAATLWTTQADENIGNAAIPHTTVYGTGAGALDMFAVTIGAGQTITLDSDFTSFDTVVRLYDEIGNLIAVNDDSSPTAGGLGSSNTGDSYLQYTVGTTGVYYVEIEHFDQQPIPAGDTYQLNISVTGHAATGGTYDADTLNGDGGNDILEGVGGNDVLSGGTGVDQLYGGAGDDILDGGSGGDEMNGGAGDDRFVLAHATGANFVYGGEGTNTLDLLGSGQGWMVDLNLGTATAGSISAKLTFIESVNGSDFADTIRATFVGGYAIYGNGGDDVLVTYDGDDVLDGGDGIDTVSFGFDSAGVTASLALTGPQATGGSGTDTLLHIENMVGSNHNDFLTGSSGANRIDAGAGNDIVEGLAGNDILIGGTETDVVSYFHATSRVVVDLTKVGVAQNTLGAGMDTLSGFEQILGSAFDDLLTGDSGTNVLLGGSGNDTLEGGAGNDSIDGDTGIDTASYVGAASAVTINLAAGNTQTTGGAGNDFFISIENVTGSNYNDTLSGDAGPNTLSGGLGNDTLSGGAGNDKLLGGSGIDTVSYADAISGITLNLISTSAQNTGGAGTDIVQTVENVIGSAFADTLTGNEFANVFTGGAGDDLMYGGLGNDTLNGGDGIDTASYATAAGAVKVSLTIAGAQSTGSAGTDTLTAIENLTGSAYDDTLTGDGGNNVLTGNAGNDLLLGGMGNDTLSGGAGIDTASYSTAGSGVTVSLALVASQGTGGAGTDTLLSIENVTGSAYDDVLTGSAQVNTILGGNGNDTIDAGSSNDTVDGGYGNDILKGAAGNDILIGNVGSDTLIGGAGADTLTGGTQNDTFTFLAIGDSAPATADRITDFAKGDILNLSAIDASTKTAGDQAFHMAAAFTHSAGEYTLAYNAGTNTTTALFDTNGDANADMTILFTGNVTALTATWVL